MALSTKRPSRGDETREKLLRDVKGSGAATKRMNIEMDAELYKQLKLRSAHEDRSISEIVRELVTEYLSKSK